MIMTDEQIMCAMIGQVCDATKAAQMLQPCASETRVKTFITRPMWEAFCRGCHLPTTSEPTPWNGIHTIRVYGSETKIIESPEFWSFSISRQ